jgi:hypothetical protein
MQNSKGKREGKRFYREERGGREGRKRKEIRGRILNTNRHE